MDDGSRVPVDVSLGTEEHEQRIKSYTLINVLVFLLVIIFAYIFNIYYESIGAYLTMLANSTFTQPEKDISIGPFVRVH
jgi:hypothetical protein